MLQEMQQRSGILGKVLPLRRARAAQSGDVMAEVVEGGVEACPLPIGYELQGIRVDAQADDAVGVVGGHAVARWKW